MEPQIQRWSAKRKVELLLSLIKGERKLVDVCREHDLRQSEVESWMETLMKAGERGLKAKSDDESAVHEKEVKELRAKVGELVLELDARKKLQALNDRDQSLLTVRGTMMVEGNEVSIAALCRMFQRAAFELLLSAARAAVQSSSCAAGA